MAISINKARAIELRNKGFSYSEIIKLGINVSPSTLSLWLRDIKLSNKQQERLNQKWKSKLKLGAKSRIKQRKEKSEKIIRESMQQIPKINNTNLWLMGVMLYWAEGSKQKDHIPSQTLVFTNSNPRMIKFYIKWLIECVKVDKNNLLFELYLHDDAKNKTKKCIGYWSKITGYRTESFDKIYYKHDTKNTYRKNRYGNYFGLLRVKVRNSTDLNRKVTGWTQGICQQINIH